MKTFIKSDEEHEAFCCVANRLVVLDPVPGSPMGIMLDYLEQQIREYEESEHGRKVAKWLEE